MASPIPENVLDAAVNITLQDLLKSPIVGPWIVSSLNNAVRTAPMRDVKTNDDDQFLQFKISQMMQAIPYETRRFCFDETGRLLRERKFKYDKRPTAI